MAGAPAQTSSRVIVDNNVFRNNASMGRIINHSYIEFSRNKLIDTNASPLQDDLGITTLSDAGNLTVIIEKDNTVDGITGNAEAISIIGTDYRRIRTNEIRTSRSSGNITAVTALTDLDETG